GSHDYKRLAPRTQHLAAQAMEVLRWRRRINDLQIIFSRQMKEALEARARMFGARSLKPVRQEQPQAAETLPFVFGAGDELIDDRLRNVPKIAVLRFPEHQPVRPIQAVSVFEAEHAGFGKRAVVNLNGRLFSGEVLQWHVFVTVLIIMQHGMTLAEGASFRILSAHAHAGAVARKA